jgi:hypothetical protein
MARRSARFLVVAWLAALAASACGPSAAEVRRAKTASYNLDYVTFWNEVTEAVQTRYTGFMVAERGRLVTTWYKVSREATQNTAVGPSTGGRATNDLYFQLEVTPSPGPPFRPIIDGHAAVVRAGFKTVAPIEHGSEDEPPWVQNRIDEMYIIIYERLQNARAEVPDAPASQTELEDLNR